MRTSLDCCGILGINVCKELGKPFSPICLCFCHHTLLQEPESVIFNEKDFSFLLVPTKGVPPPSRLQWMKKDDGKSEVEDGCYHWKALPPKSDMDFSGKEHLGEG